MTQCTAFKDVDKVEAGPGISEPAKYLFILDTPGQEEMAKRTFAVEGLTLHFVNNIRYLGAYLGLQEELVAWVKPHVEALAHGVSVLGNIAQRNSIWLIPDWECRCNSSGSTCKRMSPELAF